MPAEMQAFCENDVFTGLMIQKGSTCAHKTWKIPRRPFFRQDDVTDVVKHLLVRAIMINSEKLAGPVDSQGHDIWFLE